MEKTIKIDEEDWEILYKEKLSTKLDRIADVIKQNITFSKRFNNEKEFCSWIKENYNLLGFDKIIKEDKKHTPDFIFGKDGKEIRTEIETLSSHFILHKHNPQDIDLVICLIEDKKLPVKTIEVGNFQYIFPKTVEYRIITLKEQEYKKLSYYREKTQIPYWKIIKDIIEGKLNLEEALK